MAGELHFGNEADELAIDLMIWINKHPKGRGKETLEEALLKLGYIITEDTERVYE